MAVRGEVGDWETPVWKGKNRVAQERSAPVTPQGGDRGKKILEDDQARIRRLNQKWEKINGGTSGGGDFGHWWDFVEREKKKGIHRGIDRRKETWAVSELGRFLGRNVAGTGEKGRGGGGEG